MPPFFIPAAEGVEQTDRVYAAITAFNHLPNAERFYSISYRHNGQQRVATVGRSHYIDNEVVLAILRDPRPDAPYLICTPNRGGLRGGPILADGSRQTIATPFTPD